MYRVKQIVNGMKLFAMVSLFAVVEPDGDQRQQSDGLSCDEMGTAEQIEFISEAAQYFEIDIPHAKQLTPIIPPFFAPEKVEGQNHEDTCIIIIHKCDDSADVCNANRGKAYRDPFPNRTRSYFFVPMDQSDGN